MYTYLVKRLLISLVVLFGVTVAVFGLLQLAPGDPASIMVDPLRYSGDRDAAIAELRKQLGLDQPLYVQYFLWLGQVLSGNLGYSVATNAPVAQLIAERAPATLSIMIPALCVGAGKILGSLLGALAALRKNRLIDHIATGYAAVSVSVPAFFIALIAILIFGVHLGVVATGGMTSGQGGVQDFLRHATLPILVVGGVLAGPFSRYVRASLLDVLQEDYLTAATARGLRRWQVIRRHALRNALVPLVSVIALELPGLVGGTVIIESVFSWPGMGRMALQAIYSRDYAVILAFTLIVAMVVLASNLVADILYAVVDPRIRLDK